jgi:hypothetical protein
MATKKTKAPQWPEWMTYDEAAAALGLSRNSVKAYSRRVFGWTPQYRDPGPTAYVHRDEVARVLRERQGVV